MICAGLSDILYPGGTHGENSCIICALLLLPYAPAVTLHSTRITFTFIMLIDTCHLRFVPPSWPQYTLRRESQQRYNAVGLAKVYSVCTSNLIASHRIVVCAERNRVYPPLSSSVSLLLLLSLCTTSTVSSASWCGHFHKIARFKNSFMSRTSYEPSGIVISTSSLVK